MIILDLQFLKNLNRVTIIHIILMSLVLHSFVISHPQDWLISDELFFSWGSRTLLEGEDRTPYQMPGLHIIGAASMSIFGDNWFSLRVPIVIFSMLTLLVFYNICINFSSKQNALLATTILSFDTIFFFYSHLFMRDVPLMFFGMLSFYLYLKKKYYLAALALGVGALIKETAILFLILIIIYHVVVNFHNIRQKISLSSQHNSSFSNTNNVKKTIIFTGILCASFLFPLWIYDLSVTPNIYEPMIPLRETADGHKVAMSYPLILTYESRGYNVQNQTGIITNPIKHLHVYLTGGYLAGTFDATKYAHSQTYLPQNWILPIPPDFDNRLGVGLGWKKAKPFDETKSGYRYIGEILGVERLGFANLSLWPLGFWGSLVFATYCIIRKLNDRNVVFITAGIAAMYVPFILIHLFNGRLLFPYYFIYTIPIISIGVVLLFDKIKNDKLRIIAKTGLLSLVVAWFVWLFPIKIMGEVMIPLLIGIRLIF